MNYKLIIGVIILILLIGGGVFLWQQKGEGPAITPTQWSQAGDYKITETSEGTLVENEKAGFSFKTPKGWRLEKEQFNEKEFLIDVFSPDSIKGTVQPLSKGCGIGLNTLYQEDTWSFYSNLIVGYREKPELQPKEDTIIQVDNQSAIQTSFIAEDDTSRSKIRGNIQVYIPLVSRGLVELGITIMPDHQTDCTREFESFLLSFSIK